MGVQSSEFRVQIGCFRIAAFLLAFAATIQAQVQPDWSALETELYRFVRFNYGVVVDLARAK